MTDIVRAEMAELRAALAEKERAELANRAAGSQIDESFEHGDDVINLRFIVAEAVFLADPKSAVLEYSWDDLVAQIGPFMIDEAAEPTLRKVLSQHAAGRLTIDGAQQLIRPSVTIDDASWGSVIVQLRALGIIETGIKKRTVTDSAVYWRLTQAGDNYLVRLKAKKRVQ